MERKQTFFIAGGIVVLVVVIAFAYLYFSSKKKPLPPSPEPKPKPAPTPTPAPTPKPGPTGFDIYEQTYPIISDPETQKIFFKPLAKPPTVPQCLTLCQRRPECDAFSYFKEGNVPKCEIYNFTTFPRFVKKNDSLTYVSKKLSK